MSGNHAIELNKFSYLVLDILFMKEAVMDEDGKPFHLIFADDAKDFHTYQNNLIQAIWL